MDLTPSPPILMSRGCRIGFGVYFVLLPILLVLLIVGVWPYKTTQIEGTGNEAKTIEIVDSVFFRGMPYEVRLLVLVVLAGALGSYVHAATSFVTYVGNRTLVSSWAWWYVLRGFIGTGLGLLFYFVIRAGFLTTGADPQTLNPFGIAALSALAGMFSKQAADKLREVFDNLFRTAPGAGDDQRKDKPQRTAAPTVNHLEPATLERGVNAPALRVRGTGFEQQAVIRVRGADRETTFVSREELTATLVPEDVANSGAITITVFNPNSASESNALDLTIN